MRKTYSLALLVFIGVLLALCLVGIVHAQRPTIHYSVTYPCINYAIDPFPYVGVVIKIRDGVTYYPAILETPAGTVCFRGGDGAYNTMAGDMYIIETFYVEDGKTKIVQTDPFYMEGVYLPKVSK